MSTQSPRKLCEPFRGTRARGHRVFGAALYIESTAIFPHLRQVMTSSTRATGQGKGASLFPALANGYALVTHLSSFHIPTFTILVHAAIMSQRRALPLIDQHISALAAGNDAQQPRGWAREGRAHVYRPASPENAARKMRKTTAGQNEPRRQKGGRCPEGAARGTGARIFAAIYTTEVAAAARGRP